MTNETRIIANLNSLSDEDARVALFIFYGDLLHINSKSPDSKYSGEVAELIFFLEKALFATKTDTPLNILTSLIGDDLRREDILLIDRDTPILRMIDYMP